MQETSLGLVSATPWYLTVSAYILSWTSELTLSKELLCSPYPDALWGPPYIDIVNKFWVHAIDVLPSRESTVAIRHAAKNSQIAHKQKWSRNRRHSLCPWIAFCSFVLESYEGDALDLHSKFFPFDVRAMLLVSRDVTFPSL